jgi:hypothetical protein
MPITGRLPSLVINGHQMDRGLNTLVSGRRAWALYGLQTGPRSTDQAVSKHSLHEGHQVCPVLKVVCLPAYDVHHFT